MSYAETRGDSLGETHPTLRKLSVKVVCVAQANGSATLESFALNCDIDHSLFAYPLSQSLS